MNKQVDANAVCNPFKHCNRIYIGDVLEKLKLIDSESVRCCITSPPYWGLRDCGHDGQIGFGNTMELNAVNPLFGAAVTVLK